MSIQVQELGEQGILQLVQGFCPGSIVGDDGALFTPDPEQALVITTDMLVDQVHFSDATMTATDVGWRAAAANLSDLAAMGATPRGITIALGLPGETPVDWVEHLYSGVKACLDRFQAAIFGGDLCRSPVRSIAITAFGQVKPSQVMRRSTCKPDQAIMVTGCHGSSRAGLELLLHPPSEPSLLFDIEKHRLVQSHQRPVPRLDVLPFLQPRWAEEPGLTIGGMDSSDGLADAVLQLCRASGVGARVWRDLIPRDVALGKLVSEEQGLEWALYGGEDFELVLCLPFNLAEQLVQDLIQNLGSQAAIIGTTTQNSQVLLVDHPDPGQVTVEQELSLDLGFQHF
ncbi:MAG: thiamine-phosphate kinase [Oscillatoriales cyanobacterium RM2_1_1]|nr:thiamine-phosphate kinase [Oscillatoriales cyanobacterium SM2_3_0]NJO47407.1 thiamine-phosphate kinase [Oscillatoriales cyanobacterium RM2_1_1]